MTFKEILELIDKVADRGIASLEIEQAGMKLRIEGKTAGPQVTHTYGVESKAIAAESGGAPQGIVPDLPQATEEESESGLHIITSPIVGTFYRSANPESEPYVSVGDQVSKGKVLCIIEAMKLMNEIESDVDGVVARVYPQNAQPIEYGEKLFAVRV